QLGLEIARLLKEPKGLANFLMFLLGKGDAESIEEYLNALGTHELPEDEGQEAGQASTIQKVAVEEKTGKVKRTSAKTAGEQAAAAQETDPPSPTPAVCPAAGIDGGRRDSTSAAANDDQNQPEDHTNARGESGTRRSDPGEPEQGGLTQEGREDLD